MQLLERATLPKPMPGGFAPTKSAATGKSAKTAGAARADASVPPPIAMEDWWLGRDAHGRTGWLLSRMLEVDAPESISRYSEGQRIVGAYVLTTVHDDGVDQDNKDIPIYLTVLGEFLTRVAAVYFIWNPEIHARGMAESGGPLKKRDDAKASGTDRKSTRLNS